MRLNELTKEKFEEILESYNEPQKEVLESLVSGDYEEYGDIENCFNYGCVVGVNGFVYYHETERFFDDYSSEIFDMLNELKNDEFGMGLLEDFEFNKNNLTWLYVEQTVREFMMQVDGLEVEEN